MSTKCCLYVLIAKHLYFTTKQQCLFQVPSKNFQLEHF